MKKIIAVLAALSMLPYTMALAKEKVLPEQKAQILEGLNILPADFSDSSEADDIVTWGEYLNAAAGMMSDDKDTDAVDFAKNNNLINENVDAAAAITYEDAVKILVRAGGYTEQVPGFEETSAYLRTAGERNLTDGITLSYSDKLTNEAMVLMLYNALEADITDIEFEGQKYSVRVKNGETILSRYRNIYEVTGVLSDNGDTALSSEQSGNRNCIVVGETEIKKNGKYSKDYLGYNVRAFFKNDRGDYSLEYLYPTENNEVMLSGKDVDNFDFPQLEYMNEDERSKKIKMDPALKVIYNGQAYFDYAPEDFLAEENNLCFIDNNDDNVYEVALITSYETVVASYVTSYDGKVINKYKYDGAPNGLDISADSENYKIYFYKDGQRVEKPEIKIWDVLGVATSKGKNPIRSIFISNNVIQGVISQISDEGYIVDDELYKLNSAFAAAMAAGDSAVPEITLGREYKLYLDINGRIAAISTAETQAISYALLLKMTQDDTEEEIVRVKYMDTVGDWHESYIKKRCKLYSDVYDGKSLKASEVFESIANASGKVTPQIVQLSTDSNGEINVLKTAVSSDKPIKNKLTVGTTKTGCYRWTTQLIGNRNDICFYIASGARVFLFPEILTTNESDYAVSNGGFSADKIYTLTPYNLDKFNTSDCFVMKAAESGTEQDTLFIVSSVAKIVNSDDEIKTALFGQYGDYANYSIVAKDNSVFDGIQRGDVLKIWTNSKNEVLKVEKMYSTSTGFRPSFFYDYGGNATGYVKDVDFEKKRILLDCGDYGEVAFAANESQYKVNTFMVDRDKKGVEVLNFSDVVEGDFVVITLGYAALSNVIIIR